MTRNLEGTLRRRPCLAASDGPETMAARAKQAI
jgi:hypothetical protein